MLFHGGDGAFDVTLVRLFEVRGVVHELTCDTFAEIGVLSRVQHESMPADIDGVRRRVPGLGIHRAELEESECLIHDALCARMADALHLGDTCREMIEQFFVNQTFMGKVVIDDGKDEFGAVNRHRRPPFFCVLAQAGLELVLL